MKIKIVDKNLGESEVLKDVASFKQKPHSGEIVVNFEDGTEKKFSDAIAVTGSFLDDEG
jgi:hypothetical protein